MSGAVVRAKKLALPDPAKVAVSEVRNIIIPRAVDLRREIELRADIPAAREMCRQLEAFRKYLRDREGRDLLAAECRRTEVLIGRLLGPGVQGQHSAHSPAGERCPDVPKDERHKFRLLAGHEELVEELLTAGQVARNAILQRINARVRVVDAPDDGRFATGRWVENLAELLAEGKTFGCVYADPPWKYGNQGTRASTHNHYETMTVDELAALPVGKLAAPESHLWLWTTNGFLFECPRLFDAWGFEFKSSYVWVKPQVGIGNYLRNSHEFLLLAVRGGLVGRAKHVRSWGEFDRTRHSAKPERVRADVVEQVSPGAYLELFGRQVVPGWTVWGDQRQPTMFTGEA